MSCTWATRYPHGRAWQKTTGERPGHPRGAGIVRAPLRSPNSRANLRVVVNTFHALATPLWVNLLVLAPLVSFYFWRRTGLAFPSRTLAVAATFGVAFGFVEAAVVVYLRLGLGLVPLGNVKYPLPLQDVPHHLLAIEVAREVATIVMLVSLALLVARRARERWAMFLYVFALWDIAYYAGLWVTIGWPSSLLSDDILFLIPVPWISNVWYPLLVSGLSVAAVLAASRLGPDKRSAAAISSS